MARAFGTCRGLLLGMSLVIGIACSGSPTSATSLGPPTVVVPNPTPVPPSPSTAPGAWSETFSGSLSNRWAVSDYVSSLNGTVFVPSQVDLSRGVLTLNLRQDAGTAPRGAEVFSVEKYGFGTYTWVMRASSTAANPNDGGAPGNGQTSGAFVYSPTTEIDLEQEGGAPSIMHCVMFHDGHNVGVQDAQMGDTVWASFHTYSFVWTSASVTWFVDGQQVAQQTHDVPQDPAKIVMNHWGVQHGVWGGTAMLGVPLYFHIRSFSFEPKRP